MFKGGKLNKHWSNPAHIRVWLLWLGPGSSLWTLADQGVLMALPVTYERPVGSWHHHWTREMMWMMIPDGGGRLPSSSSPRLLAWSDMMVRRHDVMCRYAHVHRNYENKPAYVQKGWADWTDQWSTTQSKVIQTFCSIQATTAAWRMQRFPLQCHEALQLSEDTLKWMSDALLPSTKFSE